MIDLVEKALIQAIIDSEFLPEEDIYFENRDFDPKGKAMWGKLSFVPSEPFVDELGECGTDRLVGFMQFDLNVPTGDGTGAIKKKAREIRQVFTAGKYFESSGQQVTISSCGISAGRYVESYYRLILTINFYAFIPRALQN